MKTPAYGAKSDLILRTPPASRSIVERGCEIGNKAGTRQGVKRRLVMAAPLHVEGIVRHFIVLLNRQHDGTWHYDLAVSKTDGSPGVSVPGGPAGNLSRISELDVAPGVNIAVLPQTDKDGGGPEEREGDVSPRTGADSRPRGWDILKLTDPEAFAEIVDAAQFAMTYIVHRVTGLDRTSFVQSITLA